MHLPSLYHQEVPVPLIFVGFWEFLDPYKASLKGVRLTFQLVFLVNFGNLKLPETKTSL